MRVMVEMDVFLLTSRIEGLPNVLIEAQALGVPVVTIPAGGAAETLDHSRTGIVLEGSESEKAAEMIVNLLHDEAWMANARQVAPEFVKQAFCIEKAIDKILAVYDVTENSDECASGNCVVAEEPQRNDG
jgi:glycosyltransferase involved in cell wall biosynthesis